MAEATPFDELAEQYDSQFTHSMTGKAQRDNVWRFLRKRILPGSEILEVNCGTGEDALYMAGLGCQVTATDVSAAMISQCLIKISTTPVLNQPVFLTAGIGELEPVTNGKKYDLIFSNFSGLNCLNEVELLEAARFFHSVLKPGGQVIAVLFGTNCLWEIFYFLLKGRMKDVRRRGKKGTVYAGIVDSKVPIHYYSPKNIRKLFADYFESPDVRPIGVFIPPSYLDRFFKHRNILFRILLFADRVVRSCPCLANLADHYVIQLRKS